MSKKQRPPQYTHAFIDSCGFNPGGTEEAASRRILDNWPNIIVAHSVNNELTHPNTPDDVKQLAQDFIYTLETELTPQLLTRKDEIRALIQGNSEHGKHMDDAHHLFELYKHGGGYFITTDRRLLNFSHELFDEYFITTILPSEFEKLL